MDLTIMFIGGILVGLSLLLHSFKMGIKRVLGYDLILDLFLSVTLMIAFHGTQGGMMLALIGGLFISIVLRVMRWFMGYEKLGWVMEKIKFAPFFAPPIPVIRWKKYPPLVQFNKHR